VCEGICATRGRGGLGDVHGFVTEVFVFGGGGGVGLGMGERAYVQICHRYSLVSVLYCDSLSITDCHLTLAFHECCDPNKPDLKA